MIVLALAVLASASLASGRIRGPEAFEAKHRIVGGTAAVEGEIPWQVSLRLLGSHHCGGSIISPDWIITAAHCSDFPAEYYEVVSGSLKLSEEGVVHSVVRVVPHEGFDPVTFENDVAVWEVAPAFEWGPQTRPVELLEQGTPSPTGTLTTTSGWGAIVSGGTSSNELLRVVVPIYDRESCNMAYSDFGGVPPNQICAGLEEGGVDSCQGDSGGPLFFEGRLHGVVSWGNGCAYPGYPGIYTEAAHYREWIRLITNV